MRRRRIEGVGEIEARMELKNGVVKDLNLVGDYFLVGDLDALLRRLRGVRLEREALSQALPQRLEDIILHLRRDDLIDLLAEESTRN